MGTPKAPAPSHPTMAELRAREASALVDAAKGGDPRAFDILVQRYRPRIFALALHITGSPSDADDITQDAFLKAYKKLQAFEGRSEFFTWLYRIALHRAFNLRRDRTRRNALTKADDPRITLAIAVDAPGDPLRALELRRQYSTLLEALDRLSPTLKTTVILTTLQGLSYKEAAVVLETTEGTVAWRVHEARKQLSVALEGGAPAAARRDPTPVPVRRRKVTPEQTTSSQPALSLELAMALLSAR